MDSQSFGVPRPGCVLTVIHHIGSVPSSCVQSTLQATEHVWQPVHLLMSKTPASCRFEAVIVPMFSSPPLPLVAGSSVLHHIDPHGAVGRDGLPGERPELQGAVPPRPPEPLASS